MMRFALLSVLAACTDAAEPSRLQLDVQSSDHVAGTFDNTLAFDFRHDGDHQVITFTTVDGEPLVTTTIVGNVQTTDMLGGRLVVSGIPNRPNPTITGDESVSAELEARPELALVEDLDHALTDAGVDTAAFALQPPIHADLNYDYDIEYFEIGNGDGMRFLSAAGAWPTYIYVKRYTDNPGAVSVWVSPLSLASGFSLYAPSQLYQYNYATRYWWGAAFDVWCIMQYGTHGCLVRVSPYRWDPA